MLVVSKKKKKKTSAHDYISLIFLYLILSPRGWKWRDSFFVVVVIILIHCFLNTKWGWKSETKEEEDEIGRWIKKIINNVDALSKPLRICLLLLLLWLLLFILLLHLLLYETRAAHLLMILFYYTQDEETRVCLMIELISRQNFFNFLIQLTLHSNASISRKNIYIANEMIKKKKNI